MEIKVRYFGRKEKNIIERIGNITVHLYGLHLLQSDYSLCL